ncbi:MAG: VWA domain-containing protein [Fusobacterium sp. JB020]|nr:VWA domain-containing protein [Fusobacterium sp. JB020]
MKFGNLENIYYFIFPILILFLMILGMKKRNSVLKILRIERDRKIYFIKIISIIFGSILIYVALLSPQKLLKEKEIEVEGNNIYILVDTSRSMLAEDVYPNRIELGKRVIKKILRGIKGDKIGIIPFSDSAYIQMPLTEDYSIGENYVNAIDTNLISGGGTKIIDALKIANNSFKEINTEKKIVLIVSDGGEEEKDVADFVKTNNIIVYSIGIGTAKGEVIPDYKNSKRNGFIKNNKGAIVVSKLNTSFLKKLSNLSKGKYYEVNNLNDNSKEFVSDIKNIDKDKLSNEKISIYQKYYQYFTLIGIIFILFGYFFNRRLSYEE